ncbi:hypothetical protein DVT68_13075 [Dyella solisilvae]|uniref:Secreted protein n=1 Tax=Dyella solisilvae TaxID=1920168 RepID=A0A370K5U2_9GAMM|nr:hypothetical protein DVT68_13075 [Dyella solisilvae]
MCPACIGTLLVLLSGAGSAGGATALSWHAIARRRRRPAPEAPGEAPGKTAAHRPSREIAARRITTEGGTPSL